MKMNGLKWNEKCDTCENFSSPNDCVGTTDILRFGYKPPKQCLRTKRNLRWFDPDTANLYQITIRMKNTVDSDKCLEKNELKNWQ